MLITESQLRRLVREEILREEALREGALNVVLDLAGLIPGVGEFADAANALLYAKKGDYLMAGLSLISVIPAVGDVLGKGGKLVVWTTKLAGKGGKAGDLAKSVATQGPKVADAVKKAGKLMADNKDAINKVFEVAEKNEELKKYVSPMKKALEAFYNVAGSSSDATATATTPATTQKEGLFRKTATLRVSREDRLFESGRTARKRRALQ